MVFLKKCFLFFFRFFKSGAFFVPFFGSGRSLGRYERIPSITTQRSPRTKKGTKKDQKKKRNPSKKPPEKARQKKEQHDAQHREQKRPKKDQKKKRNPSKKPHERAFFVNSLLSDNEFLNHQFGDIFNESCGCVLLFINTPSQTIPTM